MAKKNNETSVNEVAEPQVENMFQPQSATINQNGLIDAINVLISAVNVAQSKGVYNLEESHGIWEGIQAIHRILQPNQ